MALAFISIDMSWAPSPPLCRPRRWSGSRRTWGRPSWRGPPSRPWTAPAAPPVCCQPQGHPRCKSQLKIKLKFNFAKFWPILCFRLSMVLTRHFSGSDLRRTHLIKLLLWRSRSVFHLDQIWRPWTSFYWRRSFCGSPSCLLPSFQT